MNSLKILIGNYRKIYDFLIDPDNKYHGIIESIKYKPDELEKILMTAKTEIQK